MTEARRQAFTEAFNESGLGDGPLSPQVRSVAVDVAAELFFDKIEEYDERLRGRLGGKVKSLFRRRLNRAA